MKPSDLFSRNQEWVDLENFASSTLPGLRLGVLYGRRRLGKSFLLRRLAREHDGIYHMAVEEEPTPALQRFLDSVALKRGLRRGDLQPRDWEHALRLALSTGGLLIIDELPYLLANRLGASIPSILQQLVDESRNDPAAVQGRVILCGSALAVMSGMLSGSKPLRGRAELDMVLKPFGYRDVAEYYGVSDPHTALRMYSVFGGVPGYRDLLGEASPESLQELEELILSTVCNPSHALFTEPAYLLREDPRITDRALYYSILSAISAGATGPTAIGAVVGRSARALTHPLDVLISAGFVIKHEDILLQRRPRLVLADRIVQFHDLVIKPRQSAFEDRRPMSAWTDAQPSLKAQLYGPAFEDLAREWVRHHASEETLGGPPGEIGTTVLNDARSRSKHEVDLLALAPGQRRQPEVPVIRMIGEAKNSSRLRGPADLHRLEEIRAMLSAGGADTREARLFLFSRTGFSDELKRMVKDRSDVELVDLDRIRYGS